MRNTVRYIFGFCLLYFAINWIADNPRTVNTFRRTFNSIVDKAVDKSKEAL